MSKMTLTLGCFSGIPDQDLEARVELSFFPASFAVPWRQCSASAEFVAAYLTREDGETGAAGFVLNELMENVVKFSHDLPVRVWAGRRGSELLIRVANHICTAEVESLQATLLDVVTGDAQEKLCARVEMNAENPGSGGSGLGYLTMRADYGAQLGFRFTPAIAHPGFTLLETEARLPLDD